MGCFDIFCTLCGGPLNTGTIWDSLRSPDPEPGGAYWDYNQNLVSDEDLEWLRDVRVVGEWQNKADQGRGRPVAAQVYYASEFDSCIGIFDATDQHGVTHWCYAFARYENEDNCPGLHFVMHSACLLIAKRWMYEEGKTIQRLYEYLSVYNTNNFIGVYLPNSHYGAQQFWEQFWVAKQGWEFIVKDPVNIPDLTAYILSKLEDIASGEAEHVSSLKRSNSTAPASSATSILEVLPLECIEQIYDELPLSSVFSFRLSCKNFALSGLSQDFWRRRLLSGRLFAMHDLDLAMVNERWNEIKDKDWRRLVRTLTRYENFYAGEGGSGTLGELHDAPVGLKNRIRIMKIMDGIFSGI